MTSTFIHLLRHGEVNNPEKVLYERLPGFFLSNRGRAMAAKVAQFALADAGLAQISAVYSSPLERTIETATPTANALGLEINRDERLIEAGNELRGRPLQVYQMSKSLLKDGQLGLVKNPLKPSWGEPFEEIGARMKNAIEDFRRRHLGEHVLVVSHESPIWITRRLYEGKAAAHNPLQRECSLASITTIEFNDELDDVVGVNYAQPAHEI